MNEEYYDYDGNPTTLEKLVRTEPEWAANVIRFLKKRIEKNNSFAVSGCDLIKCPFFIDGRCTGEEDLIKGCNPITLYFEK